MTTPRALAALALALLAAACGPKRFPGTEIPDNDDTRGVVQALERYRDALQKRDAGAVLALASPDYFDNGGTPDPADDLDRAGLEVQLPRDLKGLEGYRVQFTLRRVDVLKETATAEVFFEQYYRVKTPNGEVPRRDADVHRFGLVRTQRGWLFASGL
ncbi:MAG: hypothetical protein QM704_12140 [Anaeromyxobacteraceae bacterium]